MQLVSNLETYHQVSFQFFVMPPKTEEEEAAEAKVQQLEPFVVDAVSARMRRPFLQAHVPLLVPSISLLYPPVQARLSHLY